MTKSPVTRPIKKSTLTLLGVAMVMTHPAWGAGNDDFATLPTIKRPLPQALPLELPAKPVSMQTLPPPTIHRPNRPVAGGVTMLPKDNNTPQPPFDGGSATVVSVSGASAFEPAADLTDVAAPSHTPPSAIAPQAAGASPPLIGRITHSAGDPLQSLAQFYQPSPMCQGGWVYPVVGDLPSDGSIQALADRGYYDSERHATLSGRVVISQHQKQIRADTVTMDTATGQASASGGVAFGGIGDTKEGDLMGVASHLRYNTQTGETTAHEVAFASKQLNAHGYAKQLNSWHKGNYELEQASFSTCPPNQRLWQLDAKHIRLDNDTGRGVAKNATLKIKNTPILYLPYINFPLDARRASGFLLPRVGLDSQHGLQFSTPYYFNLAPNYDATLSPTLYSDRNPRVVAEGRYLNNKIGSGTVEIGYLPKDKHYHNKDRFHLFFGHRATPIEGLSLFTNYRQVSDGRYLSDFDRLGVGDNPLNLSSDVGATYQDERLSLELKAQTFQRLQGVDRTGSAILDKDRPYNRLPSLHASYRLPEGYLPLRLGGVLHTHSAYFKKSINDGSDSEKSGVRIYNQLNIGRILTKPYGYIHPQVALTQLYAGFDEKSLSEQKLTKEDGTHHIMVPSVSVDGGLFLQKAGAPFGWFGNEGYQLLTPRLKYQYHLAKNQHAFPNFDTKMAAVSYQQLLADSWFLGYDRVSDLHAITPAIGYRYIDGMGRTRVDFGVAEQFYLRDSTVGLDGSQGLAQGNSGLAWQLSGSTRQGVWFDASGALDKSQRPTALALALRYEPAPSQLFGLGVVERLGDPRTGQLPLSAYTASAMFPVGERWRLLGAGQYDRKYKGAMEVLLGATYQDCCIGITVYGQQHRNELQPSEVNRSVMAELSLNGLSSGGRLARLLKERVLGLGGTF